MVWLSCAVWSFHSPHHIDHAHTTEPLADPITVATDHVHRSPEFSDAHAMDDSNDNLRHPLVPDDGHFCNLCSMHGYFLLRSGAVRFHCRPGMCCKKRPCGVLDWDWLRKCPLHWVQALLQSSDQKAAKVCLEGVWELYLWTSFRSEITRETYYKIRG